LVGDVVERGGEHAPELVGAFPTAMGDAEVAVVADDDEGFHTAWRRVVRDETDAADGLGLVAVSVTQAAGDLFGKSVDLVFVLHSIIKNQAVYLQQLWESVPSLMIQIAMCLRDTVVGGVRFAPNGRKIYNARMRDKSGKADERASR